MTVHKISWVLNPRGESKDRPFSATLPVKHLGNLFCPNIISSAISTWDAFPMPRVRELLNLKYTTSEAILGYSSQ